MLVAEQGFKKLFSDGNRALVISLHCVVFEHGELRVVDMPQLFTVSKTVADLVDAAKALGDQLLHINFGRRHQIEFRGGEKGVFKTGGEVFNRRFGDQGRTKQRSIDLCIASFIKKGANLAIHLTSILCCCFHGRIIARAVVVLQGPCANMYTRQYMKSYVTDDIIYALATAWAQSALAVIRVSGDGCRAVLASCFSRPKALLNAENATLVHGYICDMNANRIDEVVAAVYTKGHGYTLEESVEFTCHGSLSVIREILELFSKLGMRSAEGGEFTYRAFLHGRMDLTQAEAVQELVFSQSERSRSYALQRLEGSLKDRISMLKQQVLTVMASVEVQLDYAEDELDEFVFPRSEVVNTIEQLKTLKQTYSIGRLYRHGARIVLAGATNAGKSSLFNLLLKQERSIVSPVKGTTRDYIEADLSIDGIPIRLYDTAGLRQSEDIIESEGIKRTEHLIGQADLVVYLVDSSCIEEVRDEDARTIVVYNKSDLVRPPKGKLAISTQSGEGIDSLLKLIAERLGSVPRTSGEDLLVIESKRQYQLLCSAEQALSKALELSDANIPLDIIAIDLSEALDCLGQLTGEVTPADILETIFSGFCVGK